MAKPLRIRLKRGIITAYIKIRVSVRRIPAFIATEHLFREIWYSKKEFTRLRFGAGRSVIQ